MARTPRRSRASRAARSPRDRALPADPRGHGGRAPPVGRARLPGRRDGPPAALARRARRPARPAHVRERARDRGPAVARGGALGDRARRRRQRAPPALRLDPDGGPELRARRRPDAIHVPGAFSPDGRALAFTHTGRNGTDFDLAVVRPRTASARELAQPGGWAHVVDWSERRHPRARAPRRSTRPLPRRRRRAARPAPHAARRARCVSTRRGCCPTARCSAPCDPGSEFQRLAVLRDGARPELLTPDDADVEAIAVDAAHAARLDVNAAATSELWLDGERVEGLPGGVIGGARLLARRRAGACTAGPPDDTTDVWVRRPGRVRARTRSASAASTARASCGRCSSEVESFDGLRDPVPALRRRGRARRCAGCTAGPSRSPGRAERRDPVPRRARASPSRRRTCAARPATAAPTTTSTTSSSGSTRSPTWPRSRARSAPARRARRRDGRLLRRLHDAGRDHRAPRALGGRRRHRRHRQLRHLPRAHRRLPARAARGRVRLARARPRVPGVDLADPQGRPHRRAADGDPRRQRPARAGRRGGADRRGAAARAAATVEYLRYEDEGHGLMRLPNRLDATRRSPPSSSGTCCRDLQLRPCVSKPIWRPRAPASPTRVVRTPVWRSDALDEALGCALWLKCEPLQRTGSFKLRGATNAVRALPAGTRGVVGGLERQPRPGGRPRRPRRRPARVIVMPADANPAKLAATIGYGATIVVRRRRPDEPRGDRARPRARERGWRSCTRSTTGT